MTKFYLGYPLFLSTLAILVLTSCDKKMMDQKISPQQKLEAETATIENMQAAYKGEKTATAKYEAFSKKAEEEGFHHISILYNAVSAAESIHAQNHKTVIEDEGSTVPIINPEYKVKSTKENLFDDISGEAYEAKKMYPDFLKAAEKANNQLAILSLTYAMRTELKHNLFFEQALEAINKNKLSTLPFKYFVCPACGDTYSNDAPKHCDFSFTEGDKFILFQ